MNNYFKRKTRDKLVSLCVRLQICRPNKLTHEVFYYK